MPIVKKPLKTKGTFVRSTMMFKQKSSQPSTSKTLRLKPNDATFESGDDIAKCAPAASSE